MPDTDDTRQDTPLFHTIPGACRRLSIGRTKLYELVDAGRLRTVRVGRRVLLPEAELQKFAAELIEQQAGQ